MAWLTNIGRIEWLVIGSIVARLALVAVNALCVVSAVLADSASIIDAMYVQAELLLVHLFVIVAVIRVSKAVAGFTDVGVVNAGPLPLLLRVPRAALLALVAARVVLAAAVELVSVGWIGDVACVGMPIAHTPATNVDVLDTVEVPPGDGGILTFDRHQVTKKGLGSQQAHPYIRCLGPLLQHRRVGEVVCTWTAI